MKRKGKERFLFAASSLLVFLYANLLIRRRYHRKYLTGRWFTSPYRSIGAEGWKWVVHDARACRIQGVNLDVPWPVSAGIRVICPENIEFDPDDLNNFQGVGNYYQALAKIRIGTGTYIAPNVGIITGNHDPQDLHRHLPPKPVTIGKNCWIGMNSIVLPGVTLGDGTVVGAGSVVTKSFPHGYCIIAGNPATILKDFGKEGRMHGLEI